MKLVQATAPHINKLNNVFDVCLPDGTAFQIRKDELEVSESGCHMLLAIKHSYLHVYPSRRIMPAVDDLPRQLAVGETHIQVSLDVVDVVKKAAKSYEKAA